MRNNCIVCGKSLSNDDIGATKRFINRGAEEFLCIPCLAAKLQVSEELLREKIEFLRKAGCSLFPRKED